MADRKNCEIRRPPSDMSSSDSEDSDFDYTCSTGSSLSLISDSNSKRVPKQEQKPVQRMPTRRPDPNVSNRNALLARENRRRKKAYVETLEKELDGMKHTNRKLHKLLRKQLKIVKKLEHEKQYYKGLISNQSDILNLVSVLNTKVPMGSAFPPKTASSCSPTDSNRSTSSMEPLANNDYNDNGSALLLGDPFLTEDFINDFNFFTDSNYEPYSESNWDDLLGLDTTPLSSLPEENTCDKPNNTKCEVQSNINGEHNYFTIESNLTEEDSGLCLHIARGKISLEYCPSCHANAKRWNNTIPEQLLVVD